MWASAASSCPADRSSASPFAHRLTTIKDYDRILVLGEEGIVEEGTHAQLLEKQGVYYRLWNQLPAEDGE